MSTPTIISDEQEIVTHNSITITPTPKDPRFDYNPLRRLSARIVDDLISGTIALVAGGIFFIPVFYNQDLIVLWIVLAWIVIIATNIMVKPLLEHYFGQTPGQRLNSLLLTTNKGDKPSFLVLFLRSLLELLNIAFPIHLFSVFSVPLREDRQSISDLICDTRVETTKVYPNMAIWSSLTGVGVFLLPIIITIGAIFGLFAFLQANPPQYDPKPNYEYENATNESITINREKRLNSIISSSSSSLIETLSQDSF
jgi:uncharacterized RDD family membrane protein YckC